MLNIVKNSLLCIARITPINGKVGEIKECWKDRGRIWFEWANNYISFSISISVKKEKCNVDLRQNTNSPLILLGIQRAFFPFLFFINPILVLLLLPRTLLTQDFWPDLGDHSFPSPCFPLLSPAFSQSLTFLPNSESPSLAITMST